jgi:hypothetical protein
MISWLTAAEVPRFIGVIRHGLLNGSSKTSDGNRVDGGRVGWEMTGDASVTKSVPRLPVT